MTTAGIEIGVATANDVAGILDLQERNLRKNGGALSVPMSREWLHAAINGMPIIVARRDGRVVGYVVSSSLADQSADPILDGMLQAHPGAPGSYVYGPICVAESDRGQGRCPRDVRGAEGAAPGSRGLYLHPRRQRGIAQSPRRHGYARGGDFTVAGVGYVVVAYVG